MSKAAKIWLIVAAALVMLGLLILCGAFIMIKGDFGMLGTSKFDENRYNINEDFESIVVDTDTADITFAPSEDGECRVVCLDRKNAKHSVKVTDGVLTIKIEDTRKWYEHIGISFKNSSVTVYLPKTEYSSLSVSEDTGDVYIPSNFKLEEIKVRTSTGDVGCYASASGNVDVRTSTGKINIDGISVNNLTLSVSTGNITASSVKCEGDINVTVSTGKTRLTNVSCKNIISDGDTGDMIMKNVIASEDFSIERDTGDVKIESCDAKNITILTDTGDVTGTLLSEKIFYVSTDTGRKDVPTTTTGGICKISTDTGDIKIRILSE
ncbi:MAG: DUF4097 family beta strand repeat protein [Clostridia bacterium]|nr:DUF4097 family beta strand repeat protein [Clostridia bacterium]